MKWYVMVHHWKTSYSSGNTEMQYSNSLAYLKEAADRKFAHNFQWEYEKLRYKSSLRVEPHSDNYDYFTIRELDKPMIVYIPPENEESAS